MDKIRRAEINVEEVQNVILEGGVAASCRIQLMLNPAVIFSLRSRQGIQTSSALNC